MADSHPNQLTEAEKTKAAKVQRLIWLIVVILIGAPIVVYWLTW